MNKYDIFTIVHPPYFKFLEEHLASLSNALTNRDVRVFIFSSQTNQEEEKGLEYILKKSDLDFLLKTTPHKISIGQGRNTIFREGSSPWAIFLDADVIVDEDYFKNLDRCIEEYGAAKGFAGGIGISNCSEWGLFEGAMDIRVYIRNLTISNEEFNKIMRDLSFKELKQEKVHEFYKEAKSKLLVYEGKRTRAFQGFNQIVKREDLYGAGGFNEEFWSAEDRELGIRFLRRNKEIVFTPSIWANHNYEFGWGDVLKRKRIHGWWYGELRRKYPDEESLMMSPARWLKNFMRFVNLPEPFRGVNGRVYYLSSFISYAVPAILSEKFSINPMKSEGGWTYDRDK